MLGKLIKFVLLTRFTKRLLLINLVSLLLVYSLGGGAKVLPQLFIWYASIVFLVITLTGGFVVLKSDVDFLFVLPIRRSYMVFSLFLSMFVAYGLLLLYLGILELNLIPLTFFVLNLSLLSVLAASTAAIASSLSGWKRWAFSSSLALLNLSSLMGFPLSPLGAFHGLLVPGTVSLSFLTLVFLFLAYRTLSNVHLLYGKSGNLVVKRPVNFNGKDAFLAVMLRALSFIDIGGRMNVAGSVGFRVLRVNVIQALGFSTAISVVYFLLVKTLHLTSFHSLIIIYSIAAEYSLLVLMSQAMFMHEPIWLSFGVMEPWRFARYYLLGKATSVELILLPFAVVNLLNPETWGVSLVTLIVSPFALIYLASITARINPVQIRDELSVPAPFSSRQYFTAIASFPVMLVMIMGAYSPTLLGVNQVQVIPYLLVADLFMGVPFLISKSFWRGVQAVMIERGFT
ncbi:hypothetical protein MetMK1DRAFT_00020250 [Metallosphaera yellowstonensis MK1]|uniref:Uncharacterized protein n=1 Tax=Metallosphaera yellowstonensis MK1 TaxID=671065 RepID=H2C649_9CREN|nr:hypothetical protein [Metallosphaera yellowstonensis]EHP69276.1 hypothetical protein MetMK1DRAFT_00020250 [Metallosphaera yellowstonensis MK1]